MGSTRVFIPDRPGATEHVTRIKRIAERLGHRTIVRPVGADWVVVIEGDTDNDALADQLSPYVFLGGAGEDGRLDRHS